MSFDILGTSCDQCREARFNKGGGIRRGVCVSLHCHHQNAIPALKMGSDDRDILRATVGNTGVDTDHRNTESAQNQSTLFDEERILPPFQQGFEPSDLSITSPNALPLGHIGSVICIQVMPTL